MSVSRPSFELQVSFTYADVELSCLRNAASTSPVIASTAVCMSVVSATSAKSPTTRYGSACFRRARRRRGPAARARADLACPALLL